MAARATVPVLIQGQEYKIRTGGDDEAVRRVAEYVDLTMSRVRSRTRTVDSRDVAVLTALNIANDLLALREGRSAEVERNVAAEPQRVQALIDLIDGAERA